MELVVSIPLSHTPFLTIILIPHLLTILSAFETSLPPTVVLTTAIAPKEDMLEFPCHAARYKQPTSFTNINAYLSL